jgi:hypothetical protein
MHDEEIREIRKIRHQISEACGHDVHKLAAYYRAVEEELERSGQFRFAKPVNEEPVTQAAGR